MAFHCQALTAQQGEAIVSLKKQVSELTAELATTKEKAKETNGTLCRLINQKNGDLRQIGELLKEASNIHSTLLTQILNIIRGESQE